MPDPTTILLLPGDYYGLQYGPAVLVHMVPKYAHELLERISFLHSSLHEHHSLERLVFTDNWATWIDLYSLDENVPGVKPIVKSVTDLDGPVEIDPNTPEGKHILAQSQVRIKAGGAVISMESYAVEVSHTLLLGRIAYTATHKSGKRMVAGPINSRLLTHIMEAAELTKDPQVNCPKCGAEHDCMLSDRPREYGTVTVACEICYHEWRELATLTCDTCGTTGDNHTFTPHKEGWHCPRCYSNREK